MPKRAARFSQWVGALRPEGCSLAMRTMEMLCRVSDCDGYLKAAGVRIVSPRVFVDLLVA